MRRHLFAHADWLITPILLAIASALANEPYGLDSRAPVGPFLNNTLPPAQPDGEGLPVINAFPHLTFPDPVGLVPQPRSNRLYVFTREGQIYFFANEPNVAGKTLFLDIRSQTEARNDCGLMGLSFHPEFGQSSSTNRGYFFVFYQYSPKPLGGPEQSRVSEKTPCYNRLSRFNVPDGSFLADPSSELVLIEQYDRNLWHQGGGMFFQPEDGFLYLSLGDEGGRNNEFGNAQHINQGLFSGVIRIDVNRDPAKSHPIRRQPRSGKTAHYYIPNDNPFVDPKGATLEEFWAIGLRSPHRMTWDAVTKTIWLGDVGQEQREEINLIEKAGNYQWAYQEGTLSGPSPRPASIIGLEKPPIYEYSHTTGKTPSEGDNCVIGGYVYRGTVLAEELGGKYIFGDNGSGRIWALTLHQDGSSTVAEIAKLPGGRYQSGLSSFGVDHAGELYLCQLGPAGQIYKLSKQLVSVARPPALLSQTGAFNDLPTLTPSPALVPYDVNSPLWSDHAIKRRWIGVPNHGAPYSTQEQIAFAPTGEWTFPIGTVFVKHFELNVDDADPNLKKWLETRLLVRDTNGAVYGLTYKWRSDHSEADLLEDSFTEELTIKTTTPVGSFSSSQDIGNSLAGSTTFDANNEAYLIQASGADIGGNSDQFRFLYQSRTGDFDVKVRVESLSLVNAYTKAGLMVRASLAPGSRHVNANVFADNRPRGNNTGGYEFTWRATTGGPTDSIDLPSPFPRVNYPNTWLRLKREGDDFTAYASGDGVGWTRYATCTLHLPRTVYFGMAVTSHDAAKMTTARFRDFGNNRGQTWYYPSRRDCLTCHTAAANYVLGVRTHQLNRAFAYPSTGRLDNQLRTWNRLGLFHPPLDETKIQDYPRSVMVTDATATLEERVRSYLAANCAQCHRPGGVRANFDARYETPLQFQGIINGAVNNPLDIPDAAVVSPGAIFNSILYLRLNSLKGEIKMPPLARNTIDAAAVATLADWIQTLPPAANALGLRGEYFDRINLTGSNLVRIDKAINFDWGAGSPDPAIGVDAFSVRWTGEIEPRFSELYTFYTASDDGVRLWVNDQLLIDHWTDHAMAEDRGSIALVAGQKYPVRLEYFENGGQAGVRLEWSSPSQYRELIPPSQLSPPTEDSFAFPPVSLQVEHLYNGQIRLQITAKTLAKYRVEASTDFIDWSPIMTFLATNGLFSVMDLEATNFSHRFYRVVGAHSRLER